METMNYSIYILFACLVAANGYVVRWPTHLTANFDELKTKDSQSPLLTADPSQGKISLPRLVVSPTSGYRYNDPVYPATAIHRQKRVIQLLLDLAEPSTIPEIAETAENWSLVYNLDKYVDDKAVEDYWTLQQKGLMLRNRKFSIFNGRHKNEAISLFKVFYGAKDFETFYKTAAWARQNSNEGCFIYALTLAVLHRADTRHITLPALYEIYPWYFVHEDILRKVDIVKSQIVPTLNDEEKYLGARVVNGTAIFDAEMTAFYNSNKEAALAYFTEDIGLNMFHYYQQMMNPHWLATNEENTKFGENWYYIHQQMLARYYLERLSNGMGEIPEFTWDDTIKTGYNPALIYPDGGIFPSREDNYTIDADGNTDYLMFVKAYEKTLTELLKPANFLNMYGGMNLPLENIVASIFRPEILSSDFQGKNYDAIARYLLGASRGLEEHKEFGFSSMEHYETSLRDPMFWQLQKHMMNFLFAYKNLLPRYTETELNFPGVKITNVDITKLYTQYEYYEIDLNVYRKTEIERTIEEEKISKPLKMKAAQARLNHKPFMVKISVNAERAVESVVRIFIAPKVDGNGRILDLDANRNNFVELDSFLYTLNPGDNIIIRKSQEFQNIAGDPMPMSQMFDKIENALLGLDIFRMNKNDIFTGFPSRLLIPKGTKTGLLLQMFVMVSPFMRQGSLYNYAYPVESNYGDNGISLGYPFDRRIETSDFYQSNMFLKDVAITHKGKENKKSWNGKAPHGTDGAYGNGMLSQGESTQYDYSSRKGFDYMAKKAARDNMDYGTKSSDPGNIEVDSQPINDIRLNAEDSIEAVTTGSLSFEDGTIKLINSSYPNVDFVETVNDPEKSLIFDDANTGHGLLKYSGNNDYSKTTFDYAAKRDAKKSLHNQKMDDNQPKDDSSNTIDTDSMIAYKMGTTPDNLNEDTTKMHIIGGNNVLLRSSGKFDYSRKKFDYEAKRNARKDIENENNKKVDNNQLKHESLDTIEMLSSVDTDRMDEDMMFAKQNNMESRKRNNLMSINSDIDAGEEVIPIMNLHLYEIVSDKNELENSLLKSSGKYDYSEGKFDYSVKKKERKEAERARKDAIKFIIKTRSDDAIIVNKDSNGVLDIKYIDNIDGDTENMIEHDVYQITEETPDSDSTMDMLLRSVGKYDYSKDKFDYSSKKKEREEIESSEKKARKLMIKTKKDDAKIVNKDVDSILDIKNENNIDSTTEHMFQYKVHQTTEETPDSDSTMDMLLRSVGNYDYSKDQFDYSSKKKEREEIESSEKKARKLMIKTKKDDAKIVNKDVDSILDIKNENNIDSTTEHMFQYKVHQTTEETPDSDSTMDMLLRYVGNYDYSKDKFDYSSKKKERKEIESSEKKARKFLIKTKKDDAKIVNKDVDSVLDKRYEDNIDSTTKHMFEYEIHQTTELNTDLDSTIINMLNGNEVHTPDGALDSVYNRNLDATKNTLYKSSNAHNREILNKVLLRSIGNTQMNYSSSKNYKKRQEKELKKAMKAERKLAAAEEKRIRDSSNVVEHISHGTNGISPTNVDDLQTPDTDFKNFIEEDITVIQRSPDETLGLANSTNKYPENIHDYVFYDNIVPIYE